MPFIVKPFLLAPLVFMTISKLILKHEQKIDFKKLIISSSIFLIFLLSSFYSSNYKLAVDMLLRLVPLVIIPFCFAIIEYSVYNRCLEIFKKTFIYSCVLLCLLTFVYCLYLNISDIQIIYSYITTQFWGYEEHPIYISLYLGIALILLYYEKWAFFLKALFFIIMFLTLFLLSRKGNIIGITIVFLMLIVTNLKIFYSRKFLVVVLISILIFITASYIFNNFFIQRLVEIVYYENFIHEINSSTGIRSIILQTCTSLFVEAPFFGYGLGGVQSEINSSLINNGHEELTTIFNYNAHNQYLQLLLTAGVWGLFSFLGILLYFMLQYRKQSYKQSQYVFLYVLICFLFESLLERQNGILTAAIFFNLFLFLPQVQNTKNGKSKT